MNSTTTNIQKVSFIFFSIIGFIHILSGLMVSNSYFSHISLVAHRSLDIPFIITALLYGISSLKLKKIPNILAIVIGIVIVVAVIYINFFIPDRPLHFNL